MKLSVDRLELALSPIEVFLQLPDDLSQLVFLASNGTDHARWSILAWNPSSVITFDGQHVVVDGAPVQASLPEVFEETLERRKTSSDSELPFLGGAIGTINYAYGYQLLDLPAGESSSQLVEWGIYDHALLYDHQEQQWWEVRRGEAQVFSSALLSTRSQETESLKLNPTWDLEAYRQRFDQLKELIRQGECYQACLTFPFLGKPVKHPRALFAELFGHHPSPMSAYLEHSSRQVMSLSPERFLHWDGKQLETKPIKGTRPRHADPKKDNENQEDLLKNEKEQAELAMITDLLRNDLARVSKPGSVQVVEDRVIQALPSVWHAYSRIVSQSKPGIGAWDIIESMFPGGSISGCPKRRAVEILRELEDSPRGIYTGCIGYISDHGQMDLSIAIRTLEQDEKRLQASFGGGIVYDSEAEREYQECLDKAKPFL